MKNVRTRIAPSPTGDPHVGTAYIALFNYVFAASQSGEFCVRIEDTDRKRCTNESEDRIFEALKWLELPVYNCTDAYPGVNKINVWPPDSNFNPFDCQGIYYIKQSDRLDLYKTYAELLVNNDKAYKCYCSKERLEQLTKENPYNLYHENCELSSDSPSFVIRLKSSNNEISFKDGLRGIISSNTYLRDPILLKSDGYPTYHLSSVIDDHFMEITHIIRGEEWISSTPIHIELYNAFDWELPEFYHLSLLRNEDKSKLSKRKNPTSILYYKELGILPETFLNYLGTLGFNFGKERFSVNEMIENFSWDKVSINGPVFDINKLKAFSAADIKEMDFENAQDIVLSEDKFEKIFELAKTRVSTLGEIIPLMNYCFGDLINWDRDALDLIYENFNKGDVDRFLKELGDQSFTNYETFTKDYFANLNIKPKQYYILLNTLISGHRSCPPVFEIMKIIGKDITLNRIRHFVNTINFPEK